MGVLIIAAADVHADSARATVAADAPWVQPRAPQQPAPTPTRVPGTEQNEYRPVDRKTIVLAVALVVAVLALGGAIIVRRIDWEAGRRTDDEV